MKTALLPVISSVGGLQNGVKRPLALSGKAGKVWLQSDNSLLSLGKQCLPPYY
jgi:hypothetical protein